MTLLSKLNEKEQVEVNLNQEVSNLKSKLSEFVHKNTYSEQNLNDMKRSIEVMQEQEKA